MINNKGVSAVIATVLIMLVTIAAVAIVSQFIIPFVRNNLDKSTECLEINKYYTFDESFGLNCFNLIGGTRYNYSISIKAKNDNSSAEKVSDFTLIFTNNEKKITKSVSYADADLLAYAGSKSLPKNGEIKSYIYSGTEFYNKMEVRTISSSGRLCDSSKEIILIKVCD